MSGEEKKYLVIYFHDVEMSAFLSDYEIEEVNEDEFKIVQYDFDKNLFRVGNGKWEQIKVEEL